MPVLHVYKNNGGRRKGMLSPNFTRFIVDPDNITEEFNTSKKLPGENKVLMRGTEDYEKVVNDYNFFTRLLCKLNKLFCTIVSASGR